MYTGVVIEESLKDKSALSMVRIVATRVVKVTEAHGTPYLEQWTLHTVEVEEARADEVAKRLMESLRDDDEWYADFCNEERHYIIFRDRIFKVRTGNEENYREAVEYGLSKGIPEEQLDFWENWKKYMEGKNK